MMGVTGSRLSNDTPTSNDIDLSSPVALDVRLAKAS
jgi:hypothetical protein